MSGDDHSMGERTNDERSRLERLARVEAPGVNHSYADRLEADLRVQHAQLGSRRTRLWGVSMRQVLAGAAVLLVALVGVAGLAGRSTPDEGVSLDVLSQPDGDDRSATELSGSDEDTVAEAPAEIGVPESAPPATEVAVPTAEPVVEPTSTPVPATPTAVSEEAVSEEAVSDEAVADQAATPAPDPTPSDAAPLSPTVPPEPTTTPTAPATPTATPAATPTEPARPTATPAATALPTAVAATPVPVATETPVPTSTPVAPAIVARCEARTTGDAVGVVCEWNELAGIDLSGFRVMRTRNGAARELVAELSPQETMAIDRLVRPGDTLTYRVLALTGDVVRSESAAIEVALPS